jgi:hypothetical protein
LVVVAHVFGQFPARSKLTNKQPPEIHRQLNEINIHDRGACEYGNELSGSIKCGEFLD